LHLTYPSCSLACADYVEEELKVHVGAGNVAALIVEPVQGEGGFIAPPPGWLERIAEICKDLDIPLVADEVQTGFGRTGTLYAMEQHPGIVPDFTLSAKSLAAGLPLAAVTGRQELMDAPGPGGLGGTYGGNPLACTAALATIELFEHGDLLERARRMGEVLAERLGAMGERYRIVGEVRGLGAMMALELVADPVTKEPAKAATNQVLAEAARNGLLTLKAGIYDNVVRILAPLVMEEPLLHEGLDILDRALAAADAANR
jgi:4-aminobutyrate aminotransferase/(S)-3-amino-2-methylpropionate transaminase